MEDEIVQGHGQGQNRLLEAVLGFNRACACAQHENG